MTKKVRIPAGAQRQLEKYGKPPATPTTPRPRPEPLPMATHIPQWSLDRAGGVVPSRRADFWRRVPGTKRVACDLCYRKCEIAPGQAGWCKYRKNVDGTLTMPDHGVLARSQTLLLGYMGGIHTYLPGAPALGIGATRCTARCAYCTSANIVWAPEKIAWQEGKARAIGTDGSWHYEMKAMLHPEAVIDIAGKKGARALVFSENEPLLSFEYTYDVARLAQEAGLHVIVYTNGFSEPAVIRKLAPFVDAVDLGIKGSLDPAFYEKKMRAPGATEAVKRALLAWRDAGIPHLMISDLIATHFQQSDDVQAEASDQLYEWIVAEIGAHTPVMLGSMHVPDGQRSDYFYLLPPRVEEVTRYQARIAATYARARAAGLVYAHESNSQERINCHACGGLLLERHAPATPDGSTCPFELIGSTEDRCTMFKGGCNCWSHTQHITDGRCDHCGEAVPIVTLPGKDLAATRAGIAARERRRVAATEDWGAFGGALGGEALAQS